MQLSSCTNLFAIIFIGVKCREVLIVVGGIVTMTPYAAALGLCRHTPTRLFFGEIRWVIKSKKPVNTAFHELSNIFNYLKSGGEENRTPVQTYSSKAFYMFIC